MVLDHNGGEASVESFLHAESARLGELVHRNPRSSTKAAVIVETRNHPLLSPVIRNVMNGLGPEWSLYVFGSRDNEATLEHALPGWDYEFIDWSDVRMDANGYSLLLRKKVFWQAIEAESVILFQADSMIVNGSLLPGFEQGRYPFIGGVYHFTAPQGHDLVSPTGDFNICGGFTLRDPRFALDALANVTEDGILEFRTRSGLDNGPFQRWRAMNIPIPEDVFFHHALAIMGKPTPTLDDCNRFCYNAPTVEVADTFSMHGFGDKSRNKQKYDAALRRYLQAGCVRGKVIT